MMAGGALAVKHKRTTLDDLLQKAEATGDTAPIDEHFVTLSQSLRADKGVAFAAVLATAVLGWWQEARSQLKSPHMLIRYARQYRRVHVGRLLPIQIDRDIVGATLAAALAGDFRVADKPHALDALKGVSRSSAGADCASQASTAIGSSASSPGGLDSRILAAVERSSTAIGELSARVNSLVDEIERVSTKVEAVDRRTTVRCFECGSTSHRVHECPQKKAKETADKDKADKEK